MLLRKFVLVFIYIFALFYQTNSFTEKQFKNWSKKAIKLRDSYGDNQIEKFKIELQKLSQLYCKK